MLIPKVSPLAIGLWIGFAAGAGWAQEAPIAPMPTHAKSEPALLQLTPAKVEPNLNQRMADAIAERLQLSGCLHGYQIDILYAEGVAELSGHVADMAQRDEVLRLVQSVSGVAGVRDRINIGRDGVVQASQNPDVKPGPIAEKLVPLEKPALENVDKVELPSIPPVPSNQASPWNAGMPQEPMSIMNMGPSFNPGMPTPVAQQPPLPPYAWPTYAPYNNYSRVAYPTLYPYQAFPFIGPMYPFPKIPLGWRSVSLTWQDGHWFYGRKATGHDWWRIRYY